MRVISLLALVACGDGEAVEECIPDLPEDCQPLYEPTFDQVYTQTLEGSCALSGCHGDGASQGGLSLEGADAAHAALVDGGRVIPGEAACSALMMRLEAYRLDVMPPGAQLPDAERCAIGAWIDAGAER